MGLTVRSEYRVLVRNLKVWLTVRSEYRVLVRNLKMWLTVRSEYRVLVRNLKEKDCLENTVIDKNLILKGTTTTTSSYSFFCARSICPRCTTAYKAYCATLNPPPHPGGLHIPTSTARCLHVHTTREILAAKGGTVGENVGR